MSKINQSKKDVKGQQIKTNRFKVNEDYIDQLFDLYENEDSRVDIGQIRDKIKSLNLQQECKLFMKKTEKMDEQNYLKQSELKNLFLMEYNNEEDLRYMYEVITEVSRKQEIDAETLEKLSNQYSLELTKEDIAIMIAQATTDSKKTQVSFNELRSFLKKN